MTKRNRAFFLNELNEQIYNEEEEENEKRRNRRKPKVWISKKQIIWDMDR